jgi:hypothetical protein
MATALCSWAQAAIFLIANQPALRCRARCRLRSAVRGSMPYMSAKASTVWPLASKACRFVQHLDPVPHRRGGAALQVLDAADVGRHDGLRLQRPGGPACGRAAAWPARAAARCRCRPSRSTGGCRRRQPHLEAQRAQVLLDAAAQLLAVLQRARRVEGQPPAARAATCAAWGPCSAGTRSGSSSLRSRVSSLMRAALSA